MDNKWKEIWNGKGKDFITSDLFEIKDEFSVYSALKKLDGYDVSVGNEEAYYKSFYHSAVDVWESMIHRMGITSAYEVGCGSGANLYLFKNRGIKTGGIDYSESLANVAKKMLGNGGIVETGEAIKLSENDKYDLVFLDGVFPYFPNEEYGEIVLDKMYKKAQKIVAIFEVFDKAMQFECEHHRRECIPNYDEKYEGLDKTFYPREMFHSFAEKHHCKIEFSEVKNKYYWNSRYLFNCYIYKE